MVLGWGRGGRRFSVPALVAVSLQRSEPRGAPSRWAGLPCGRQPSVLRAMRGLSGRAGLPWWLSAFSAQSHEGPERTGRPALVAVSLQHSEPRGARADEPACCAVAPQAPTAAGRRVEQVTRSESAGSIFHVPGTAPSAEQRDVGLGPANTRCAVGLQGPPEEVSPKQGPGAGRGASLARGGVGQSHGIPVGRLGGGGEEGTSRAWR